MILDSWSEKRFNTKFSILFVVGSPSSFICDCDGCGIFVGMRIEDRVGYLTSSLETTPVGATTCIPPRILSSFPWVLSPKKGMAINGYWYVSFVVWGVWIVLLVACLGERLPTSIYPHTYVLGSSPTIAVVGCSIICLSLYFNNKWFSLPVGCCDTTAWLLKEKIHYNKKLLGKLKLNTPQKQRAKMSKQVSSTSQKNSMDPRMIYIPL